MRRTLVFAIGSVLAISDASAQGPLAPASPARQGDVYTLTGLVLDSLRKRPLAGADVLIDGTALRAVTDSLGRFQFDSIPAGDHRIGFLHPFLDSLSVAVAPLTFAIPLEPGVGIVLAIPSPQTLMRAMCRTDSVEGKSIVVGRVTDPDTGAPRPGAEVHVAWTDVEVSKKKGIESTLQLYQGTADETGAFRVCGIPGDIDAVIYASHDSVSTARVPLTATESGLILRNLTLATPGISTVRRATVTGRVVAGTGTPVGNANVTLAGTTRSTKTDSKGEFTLGELPLGTQSVVVRRIGYSPATVPVELTSTGIHRVEAVLSEYALVIDPTYVIAQRDRGLAQVGFTQRRKRGLGAFRSRSEFERDNPVYLSDIIGKMRGLRLDITNGQKVVRSAGPGNACVQLVIDGLRWEPDFPGEFDESIFPQHVAAIEVYSGASVPLEFEQSHTRGCATVVIWTRTRVKDFVEKPAAKR
jgi:hypothetical protein